jgi:hypothetical protein
VRRRARTVRERLLAHPELRELVAVRDLIRQWLPE